MSFASLSVKPALLTIFETYFLALKPGALRPALKAIILGLLPGLEEDASEEFERTLNILTRFKDALGDQYFWQCLFLASITSPSRRQGALAYLTRYLPRLSPVLNADVSPRQINGNGAVQSNGQELSGAIRAVASPEPGLFIRCFATGLQDEQLLVQRGFLDLLVTHLPLMSPVLHQKVSPEDLERLIAAAASVVARREMNLNRRLWTWFLGPEPVANIRDGSLNSPTSPGSNEIITSLRNLKDTQVAHFERYGLSPLVYSIQSMIENGNSTPLEKARPFRICLSLMDRWEIGGLVVPRIFLQAMESVWRYQKVALSKDSFMEVLRSANVFFDGVESSLIWAEITKILRSAFNKSGADYERRTALDRLDLVLFIITRFSLREEEMLITHMPIVALILLAEVRTYLKKPQRDDAGMDELVVASLKIVSHLLDLTPDRAFAHTESSDSETKYSDAYIQTLVDRAHSFYGDNRSTNIAAPYISGSIIGGSLLHIAIQSVVEGLRSEGCVVYLDSELFILDKLVRKVPTNTSKETTFSVLMQTTTEFAGQATENTPFSAIAAVVSTLDILYTAIPHFRGDRRIRQIVPKLIERAWIDLSPSKPKYNVEAVRCIWRIHSIIFPDNQLIESSLATLVTRAPDDKTRPGLEIDSARRFTTLWAHSGQKESLMLTRPLLTLLDSLFDTKTEIFLFTSSWLQSLSSMQR